MFQSIRSLRPKLNKFDLSHDVKMSFKMGRLVPILCEEVVPGDRFQVKSEIMMRLAPMLAPVMHRVDVWTHYFFVPNRLLWTEWEDFITGGEDGLQSPVAPYFSSGTLRTAGLTSKGTVWDYFGLPVGDSNTLVTAQINALPFRAYTEIFNEYYRDQNLTPKISNPKSSGQQLDTECAVIRRRAWEKDYFTSALPWAQRGNPVEIPGQLNYKDITDVYPANDDPVGATRNVNYVDPGTLPGIFQTATDLDSLRIENLESIGIDINDLRTSNSLQKWLELAARGGSRYIEQIRNFFGITSSDARLQRPEFLGGGKQNVMISEVLQTAATETGGTTDTPLGEMAGHGVSVGSTNRFRKGPFEEHGWIIGICSVLPRTAYQNGIARKWSRDDKFDYYFPQFAHLGEQAILNKEIYFNSFSGSTPVDINATFGYQARYAEYKHAHSRVAGDFRDNLAFWHMGRQFTSTPSLNGSFVYSDPTTRIFANTDTSVDTLWCQIFHSISALRPMPYYGTPRL